MKNRIQKIVSVTLLIVYGVLTLVVAPIHHHYDICNDTRSQQSIAQHADASNCKHHAIETHSDCTICSIVTHTVTISAVTFAPQAKPRLILRQTALFFAVIHDISSTHSRRGPPQLLA